MAGFYLLDDALTLIDLVLFTFCVSLRRRKCAGLLITWCSLEKRCFYFAVQISFISFTSDLVWLGLASHQMFY